ncbi:hypothetical protein EBZ35_07930, partial [bacterium]|nr:hypothetical protein [bacterium]
LTVNVNSDTTWDGVISNGGEGYAAGNVIVTNGGEAGTAWTVTAQQTYTGTTEIQDGATVKAGDNDIFEDSSSVQVDGTFNTNGYDQTVTNLSGEGSVTLSNGSTGGSTLTVDLAASTTWNGVISNGGEGVGNVVVTGGGEGDYVWTVNAQQTYTGTTEIQDGATVKAGTSNIIADSIGVTVDGLFNANGYNQTLNDLGGSGSITLSSSSSSSGSTLTVNTVEGSTWSGVISNGGEGVGNLVVTNGGEAGTAWTVDEQQEYTGTTTINSGAKVIAGATSIIADSSDVTVNGTFDANGYNQTLHNLSGSGSVTLSGGSTSGSTLTVSLTDDTSWGGVISNGGEGYAAGNVIVTTGAEGSYDWTVNAQQTYTGTTEIQADATVIAGTSNIISSSSDVTVDGTFNANGYNQTLHNLSGEGSVTLSSSSSGGSTLTVSLTDDTTWDGVISNGGEGVGSVVVTTGAEGSYTWTVNSQQTYTGTTEIDSDVTVKAGTTSIIADSSAVLVDGTFDANGYDQTLHNLSGEGSVYLSNGSDASTLTVNVNSDTTWDGVISNGGEGYAAGNVIVTNGG